MGLSWRAFNLSIHSIPSLNKPLKCHSYRLCIKATKILSMAYFCTAWKLRIAFKVLFYVWVELMSNVRIVWGVQQSDSVIYIHGTILSQFVFPFRLLQDIEQSSQCYTVSPFWLSILNIIHDNPKLPNVKRKEESKKGRRKEHATEILYDSQSLQ